jgi:translation initiation factor IF-1
MKYKSLILFILTVSVVLYKIPLLESGTKKFTYPNLRSIGFISKNHVPEAGFIIKSYDNRVLISEGDKVLISLSKKDVKVGDIFSIYRESEAVKHPLTGKFIGYKIDILGEVEIINLKKEEVGGKIKRSFSYISPGDKIQSFKFPSDEIILKKCESPLEGVIIAVAPSIDQFAEYNIVYIDKGESQGVKRGNIFTVYKKKGKEIEKKKGKLLILSTQKDTSTALIIESREPMKVGELIRGDI